MILKNPRTARQEQKMSGVLTVLILVMFVLLLQLWLLNIAVEAYLAARIGLAAPTFFASLCCFGLNLIALRYLLTIDKRDV